MIIGLFYLYYTVRAYFLVINFTFCIDGSVCFVFNFMTLVECFDGGQFKLLFIIM
jgi:hypothetical protein